MAMTKKDAKTACLLDMTALPSLQRLSEIDPALAKQIAAALEKVTKSTYTSLRHDNDPTHDSTPKGPATR